jgi:hypothetical protein
MALPACESQKALVNNSNNSQASHVAGASVGVDGLQDPHFTFDPHCQTEEESFCCTKKF